MMSMYNNGDFFINLLFVKVYEGNRSMEEKGKNMSYFTIIERVGIRSYRRA